MGTCGARKGGMPLPDIASNPTVTLRYRILSTAPQTGAMSNWQGLKTHVISVRLSLLIYLATSGERFHKHEHIFKLVQFLNKIASLPRAQLAFVDINPEGPHRLLESFAAWLCQSRLYSAGSQGSREWAPHCSYLFVHHVFPKVKKHSLRTQIHFNVFITKGRVGKEHDDTYWILDYF